MRYAITMPKLFYITPKPRCKATGFQYVKTGGITKAIESILRGLTSSLRSVHKAPAMIAYLDSLEDLRKRLRAAQ